MYDDVWESIFKRNEWGKYPSEELVRFIAQAYYKSLDRRSVRILEIGCGPGANLWYCAREGFEVYGVDGSETAIQRCRERLDSEVPGWRGEMEVGRISDLRFSDGQFDAVIDNEAVCCNSFAESCQIYSEAARVLKPGGLLFVRTFSVDSWGYGSGTLRSQDTYTCSEGPMAGKGECRFTRQEQIEELLGDCLAVEAIETIRRTVHSRRHEIVEWVIHARKL